MVGLFLASLRHLAANQDGMPGCLAPRALGLGAVWQTNSKGNRHMLPRTLILTVTLTAVLTGCSAVPALETANTDRDAPFPALIPLGPLLAEAARGGPDQTALATGPGSRIDQLNARANGLRGQIIDPAVRARMQAGVDTTALQ